MESGAKLALLVETRTPFDTGRMGLKVVLAPRKWVLGVLFCFRLRAVLLWPFVCCGIS